MLIFLVFWIHGQLQFFFTFSIFLSIFAFDFDYGVEPFNRFFFEANPHLVHPSARPITTFETTHCRSRLLRRSRLSSREASTLCDPRLSSLQFARGTLTTMMKKEEAGSFEPATLGAVRFTWWINPPDHGAPFNTILSFAIFSFIMSEIHSSGNPARARTRFAFSAHLIFNKIFLTKFSWRNTLKIFFYSNFPSLGI